MCMFLSICLSKKYSNILNANNNMYSFSQKIHMTNSIYDTANISQIYTWNWNLFAVIKCKSWLNGMITVISFSESRLLYIVNNASFVTYF